MASESRGVVLQQIDRLYRDGTMCGLGDGQLLDRYLTCRDEGAFEALVQRHGPMVLGLCRRALRDPRDIEDAFQATFLVLVRKAPTIRDRGHLANWLFGVAHRVARRARTNALRRRDREVGVANLEAPASEETANDLEIGSALNQELRRVPRKYRVPLILCYLNGRTHDQAARELGCPVGTVRSRMARGRDLLRRRLISRGHAPTAAILGHGSALPTKFAAEAVPASLVAATVDAAIGIGTSKTFSAGAASASALSLTQGVLATMKISQLKWIGLAIAATGLSAASVVTMTYASAQVSKGNVKPVAPSAAVSGIPSDERDAVAPTPIDPNETYEKQVERKLGAFLGDIGFFASDGSAGGRVSDGSLAAKVLASKLEPYGFFPAPSKQVQPPLGVQDPVLAVSNPPAVSNPVKQEIERTLSVDASSPAIRKLQVELELAIKEAMQAEKLVKSRVISAEEMAIHAGKVRLVKAGLYGLDDELGDELARLNLEVRRKKAELNQARAQKQAATAGVVRNLRLNERKAGIVDAESVARAEADLQTAQAQCEIKEVEIEETELQISQLQRRRSKINEILKLADQPTSGTSSPVEKPTR